MTPYAVLLAKHTDSDDTIRRLYHAIVRYCHPDALRGMPQDSQDKLRLQFHRVTEAYNLIKTDALRTVWSHRQELLSGNCAACKGTGTAGTRMFKGVIRVCGTCKGEGRV